MKKHIIKRIYLLLLLTGSVSLFGQIDHSSEIYEQLKAKDSLLFNIGFNTCKLEPFEKLISDDFEFYHDLSGITSSKATFITQIKEGLCKSPSTFQSRRELVSGSLEVFILKDKGKIYGAIQKGIHKFYEKQLGENETSGSIARFTHLWLLENNEWKISRALSYDHKAPTH